MNEEKRILFFEKSICIFYQYNIVQRDDMAVPADVDFYV